MVSRGTNVEYLANEFVEINPNTTYTESMLIRYDGTLPSGIITFYAGDYVVYSHHSVPATIEIIRDDAVYYVGDTPYTIARISAT